MKFKLLFLLIAFIHFTNAQNDNLSFINFKYKVSSIKNCSDIEIMIIYNGENNPTDIKIEYCKRITKKRKTKTLSISNLKYKTLVSQFYKINNSDVFNYSSSCHDGNNIELSAGNLSNSISYNLSCLNKQKINTPLKELIITIQMILKVSDVKINDFN